MKRRGFIGSVIGTIVGLLGIRTVKASLAERTIPSFRWIREQLTGKHWQLVKPALKRCWEPDAVQFADIHCGESTCPMGEHSNPEKDGFRAIITTTENIYNVAVKPDWLACSVQHRWENRDNPRIALSNGNRTVETWHRIVADIERVETTGSKYKNLDGTPV